MHRGAFQDVVEPLKDVICRDPQLSCLIGCAVHRRTMEPKTGVVQGCL